MKEVMATMAEKRKVIAGSHKQGYPYDKWFRMGKFTLVKGRDFWCRPDSMMQALRVMAGPRKYDVGLSISTNDAMTEITVRIVPKQRRKKV